MRLLACLIWGTFAVPADAGPVLSLQRLEELTVDGLQKGRPPTVRGPRPAETQPAAVETVFLDLSLCFNGTVEVTAVEFYVDDVAAVGNLSWRVLHPMPSSSQSLTQWFRLGDAWPAVPPNVVVDRSGAYRSELQLRLHRADCWGWSVTGGVSPLAYDQSSSTQVAWAKSSEPLHDAVELYVKRPGLDRLTGEHRKELAIDWTGLEMRTYSVRLLYQEVAAAAPLEAAEVVEKAPVVQGGNPACWRAGYTFQRCCLEDGHGCWDSSWTFDRCCTLTTSKRSESLQLTMLSYLHLWRPRHMVFQPLTPHYDLRHLLRDNAPRLGPLQDDEALFLYGLVRAVRPRTIVEFGTSHGFSAMNWMAAIGDDPLARVFSYDILPYPSAQALEDSDTRFTFHSKSQTDFEAADVEHRPVDLALFDAGHLVEYSLRAFERLLPSLAPSATVAVHDTGLHVLDHGTQAPREQEGLPFTAESCRRAGHCLRFPGCGAEADTHGYCLGRAHRLSERRFVTQLLERWPDFRPLHVHSRRVFRHGLTLLQRGDFLTPENPQGAF